MLKALNALRSRSSAKTSVISVSPARNPWNNTYTTSNKTEVSDEVSTGTSRVASSTTSNEHEPASPGGDSSRRPTNTKGDENAEGARPKIKLMPRSEETIPNSGSLSDHSSSSSYSRKRGSLDSSIDRY